MRCFDAATYSSPAVGGGGGGGVVSRVSHILLHAHTHTSFIVIDLIECFYFSFRVKRESLETSHLYVFPFFIPAKNGCVLLAGL